MLRNKVRECCTRSLQASKGHAVRSQSSSSGKSAGGRLSKVAVIATGATFGLLGAGTALAKYDPTFRKGVEQAIPYADQAFNAVLGPISAPSASKPLTSPPPSAKKQENATPPASLLQKKLERESKSQLLPLPAKPVPAPPATPTKQPTSSSILPGVPAPVLEKPAEAVKAAVVPLTTTVKAVSDAASNTEKETSSRGKKEGVHPKSGFAPTPSTIVPPAGATTKAAEWSKGSSDIDINSLPDNVRDKLKQEMTEQLKLQLSAYNDYLHDQLKLQQDELSRMHALEMEERVLEEKMRYQRELAGSIVRLQDVENVLQVRERLDREERELKQIWFLCQQMNDCLKSNPSQGMQVEPVKLFNQSILPVLERIIKNDDTSPLVRLAVQSIQGKKDLMERGIYTEDALIARFDKVSRICKRVCLIGDEGGSLYRFLLSFVTPSLLFDSVWRIPKEELDQDAPINPANMDTFSILARVRHHLNQRNLEMSLRYANQLRGEPRKVAADWIRDVRNHLEVRQASTLIQAQASAVSLKTFSSS